MAKQEQQEVFGYRARVQLGLRSYMQIGLFISFTLALIMTIALSLTTTIEVNTRANVSGLTQYIWLYTFFGFLLLGLASTAVSFIFYRAWCQRRCGLPMTGKFALSPDAAESE